jgi:hypothetical protein
MPGISLDVPVFRMLKDLRLHSKSTNDDHRMLLRRVPDDAGGFRYVEPLEALAGRTTSIALHKTIPRFSPLQIVVPRLKDTVSI